MQKKLGAQVAKSLRLRLSELRRATEMNDLLLGAGNWEELKQDRQGQWSSRLTKNWRLIVQPEGNSFAVLIIEITDYHKR